MKRNNLHLLATSLFILISIVSLGCARQSMTGEMGKGMEPKMEEQKMEAPMQEMPGQGMDTTSDSMKNDAATDSMGKTKQEMMK